MVGWRKKRIYDFARAFDKDGMLYGVNYHHIHFHLIEGVHIEVHLSSPLRNWRLHKFCNLHRPTEWAISSVMELFTPNCYVEVGPDSVHAKVKALSKYRGVMRPYPHPCSEAAITGLAAYRGSQFQLNYAEAFEVVLRKY